MTWIPASCLALACFSAAFVLLGRLGPRMEAAPLTVWLVGLQAVIGCLQLMATGARALPPSGAWILLLPIAALCYVGNLAQVSAIAQAPNPGFPLSIIGASTVVVPIVAGLCFGAPVGFLNLIGSLLCLGGVALIVLAR